MKTGLLSYRFTCILVWFIFKFFIRERTNQYSSVVIRRDDNGVLEAVHFNATQFELLTVYT